MSPLDEPESVADRSVAVALSPAERMSGLDILRGIAILLVLGRHVDFALGGGIAAAISNRWLWLGWTGVDLFFAISGFLVSGLLFREFRKYGDIHVGRFLIRRGFKIYPSFYVFVLISIVAAQCWGQTVTGSQILSECLFLRNYWSPFLGHTWSLDVEEHFYFLLAFTLFLASRFRNLGWIPWAVVVVGIVCPLFRYATSLTGRFDYESHFFPTHLRIDELSWGVLLSYAYHFHRERLEAFSRRQAPALLALGVLSFLPAALIQMEHSVFMQVWYPSVVSLGSCCLISYGLFAPYSMPNWTRFFVRAISGVGFYSYTIYLWHMLMGKMTFQSWAALGLPRNSVWQNYIYMLLAVFCGVIMTKVVEKPCLLLRDRYFPSRSSLIVVAR